MCKFCHGSNLLTFPPLCLQGASQPFCVGVEEGDTNLSVAYLPKHNATVCQRQTGSWPGLLAISSLPFPLGGIAGDRDLQGQI